MSTEQPSVFRMVAKIRAANSEIVKSVLNLSQIQQQNGQSNHMRSCIFQLRRHQTHSTFPLSQAEFAFYFYPLAFVLVILDLVPFLAFLGPSQSRAGQPDTPHRYIQVPARCRVFACYLLFLLHLLLHRLAEISSVAMLFGLVSKH